MNKISQDHCLSIYNSEKRELIAIFSDLVLLSKYLSYNKTTKERIRNVIYQAWRKKSCIGKSTTCLNIKLAIRTANKDQLLLLDNNPYILLVDYIPQIPFNMLITYDASRIELYEEHCGILRYPTNNK